MEKEDCRPISMWSASSSWDNCSPIDRRAVSRKDIADHCRKQTCWFLLAMWYRDGMQVKIRCSEKCVCLKEKDFFSDRMKPDLVSVRNSIICGSYVSENACVIAMSIAQWNLGLFFTPSRLSREKRMYWQTPENTQFGEKLGEKLLTRKKCAQTYSHASP